uniref:Mitochondrial-processing peptidase subunit beta n=1 Tax=Strigamia maritima TaxID=126957 RepID=T1JF60_STRMM
MAVRLVKAASSGLKLAAQSNSIIPKRWSGPGVGRARILSYQDALASIPETTITTLSNGIRVGTETTPLPICTVGVWLDAGSRYETNRTNGVANLLEHMLFKGTQKRPQAELEAEIEAMGAHLNAYTTREQTAFYFKCMAQDLPKAVEILGDIMQNSKLEESEIEREKGVIMREMEEAETNISDVVFDHLHSMAYQGTPLGMTVLGPPENIKSMTKNDIINYIKNTCKGPRIVLAAAGGVRHEELVELGNQHFNKITQTYEGAVPILTPTRFTGSEMRHRDDWMPFANIALAVEGAGWISPDCIPLMVASSMVGNWDQTHGGGQNLSSNVASIVAKNKACHSFQSFYTCYRDTGLWGIQFICEAMKCEMTLYAIQEEWMRMCTSLTFTEVERAKNTLRTKLLDQLDGTTGVCEDIGRQLLSFNRRIPLIELEAQIAAVTPQTIRDVLMTYVYNRCPAVAAVGPRRKEMCSTKKGSVLTCELYHLFQEYIHGGCTNVPDSRLLEAMVSEPVNNAAKRKRLRKKFKSWAARLAIRPVDGRLIYKSTGKLIVPEEFFVPTIERKHSFNGQKHLTLSQTIDAIMGEYSVGKREFGIDRDLIVAVVNHCSHPDCQRAFFQRQHHRNTSQGNLGHEFRKQIIALKLFPPNNDGNYTSSTAMIPKEEMNYEEPGYILPNDIPTFDENNVDDQPTESETRNCGGLKMTKCRHDHRFAPIQPKPLGKFRNYHVHDEKKLGDVKNNPWHIPVRCVPVPHGIAVARSLKNDKSSSIANLGSRGDENVKCDNGDKPPVRVDELYLLLLKRIQMIRRVLRPSLSTNSARLQDILRTYINDGVGIIQRLRHDVAMPPPNRTSC